MRIIFRQIVFFLIVFTGLVSCEKKSGNMPAIDILTLPSLTRKNFETIYTDSGKVQLILSAPLLESYNKTEDPYSEFTSGIKVLFYDGHKEPVASVTAKYARFSENKNLWELKDSVLAINEAGERLETELLFWDQKKELIYTDRFVKITTEDQIVQGYGLESDPRLSKRKIKNLSATIYINDVP
jgi:LPS export ABC transporter protein LptC